MKELVLIGLGRHLKLDQIEDGWPTGGFVAPPKQQSEKMGVALGIGECFEMVHLQPVESLTQTEHLVPRCFAW